MLTTVGRTLLRTATMGGSAIKVAAAETTNLLLPGAAGTTHATLDLIGKSTGLAATPLAPAELSKEVFGKNPRQNFRDLYFSRIGLGGGSPGVALTPQPLPPRSGTGGGADLG